MEKQNSFGVLFLSNIHPFISILVSTTSSWGLFGWERASCSTVFITANFVCSFGAKQVVYSTVHFSEPKQWNQIRVLKAL